MLRAIVDRAAALHGHEAAICEVGIWTDTLIQILIGILVPQAMCNAFDLTNLEDRKSFVPCVLTLKPLVVRHHLHLVLFLTLMQCRLSNTRRPRLKKKAAQSKHETKRDPKL